ncbi:MAG: hypothetical protein H0T15_08020 [Thermoleophilaceae bacterium]|nr:hypothetical protein [Thermoleophilaceae bacterium]
MSRSILIAGFALLVALPVPAHAVSVGAGPGVGPALGADGAYFTEKQALNTDLRVLGPGGRAKTLSTLLTDDDPAEDEGGGSGSATVDALGASPNRLVFGTSGFFNKVRGFSHNISTSTPGAKPSTIASISGDEFNGPYCGPDIGYTGFDVSGNAVAYASEEPACPFEPPPHPPENVFVADFDAGGAPQAIATAPAITSGVRIAGRFVAWRQATGPAPGEVVVFDRAAGAIAYSAGPVTGSIDVQEDGKLVGTGATGELVWFSPEEPVAHPVGASGIRPLLSAGRVAYLAGDDNASRLQVQPLTGGGSPVTLAAFAGKRDTVRFDFDGTRAAWRSPGCGLERLTLEDASTPAPGGATATAPNCSPTFSRRTLRLRKGRVRVPVACSTSCAAELSLTGGVRAATVDATLSPGHRQTFRITKRSLKRAGRKRSVRVKLRAALTQVGGNTKVFRRSFTLRLR